MLNSEVKLHPSYLMHMAESAAEHTHSRHKQGMRRTVILLMSACPSPKSSLIPLA